MDSIEVGDAVAAFLLQSDAAECLAVAAIAGKQWACRTFSEAYVVTACRKSDFKAARSYLHAYAPLELINTDTANVVQMDKLRKIYKRLDDAAFRKAVASGEMNAALEAWRNIAIDFGNPSHPDVGKYTSALRACTCDALVLTSMPVAATHDDLVEEIGELLDNAVEVVAELSEVAERGRRASAAASLVSTEIVALRQQVISLNESLSTRAAEVAALEETLSTMATEVAGLKQAAAAVEASDAQAPPAPDVPAITQHKRPAEDDDASSGLGRGDSPEMERGGKKSRASVQGAASAEASSSIGVGLHSVAVDDLAVAPSTQPEEEDEAAAEVEAMGDDGASESIEPSDDHDPVVAKQWVLAPSVGGAAADAGVTTPVQLAFAADKDFESLVVQDATTNRVYLSKRTVGDMAFGAPVALPLPSDVGEGGVATPQRQQHAPSFALVGQKVQKVAIQCREGKVRLVLLASTKSDNKKSETDERLSAIAEKGDAVSLAVHPLDNNVLAVSCAGGRLYVINMSLVGFQALDADLQSKGAPCSCFAPDGRWLLVATSRDLTVYATQPAGWRHPANEGKAKGRDKAAKEREKEQWIEHANKEGRGKRLLTFSAEATFSKAELRGPPTAILPAVLDGTTAVLLVTACSVELWHLQAEDAAPDGSAASPAAGSAELTLVESVCVVAGSSGEPTNGGVVGACLVSLDDASEPPMWLVGFNDVRNRASMMLLDSKTLHKVATVRLAPPRDAEATASPALMSLAVARPIGRTGRADAHVAVGFVDGSVGVYSPSELFGEARATLAAAV